MIGLIRIAVVMCAFVMGWIVSVHMEDAAIEEPDYDPDETNLELMIFAIGFTFGMLGFAVGQIVR